MKRNGARTWQNHSDAATISKLSLRAAEGYSSFCCLTSKQLCDQIVELKEKPPREKSEKKVGYVTRRNCERSGRKIPVLRQLQVYHEQFVAVRIEVIESMNVWIHECMSSSRQKRGTRWQGERKYLWSAIAERTLRIQNDLISNLGEGSAVHFPFHQSGREG